MKQNQADITEYKMLKGQFDPDNDLTPAVQEYQKLKNAQYQSRKHAEDLKIIE